jgi:hypothetical protein
LKGTECHFYDVDHSKGIAGRDQKRPCPAAFDSTRVLTRRSEEPALLALAG